MKGLIFIVIGLICFSCKTNGTKVQEIEKLENGKYLVTHIDGDKIDVFKLFYQQKDTIDIENETLFLEINDINASIKNNWGTRFSTFLLSKDIDGSIIAENHINVDEMGYSYVDPTWFSYKLSIQQVDVGRFLLTFTNRYTENQAFRNRLVSPSLKMEVLTHHF